MIYWITGRSGSGKTTLAHKMQKQISDSIILDGDEIREKYKIKTYTDDDRIANLSYITAKAKVLEMKGITPIIACISPIKKERKYFQSQFKNCLEIQLPFGCMWKGTIYEE